MIIQHLQTSTDMEIKDTKADSLQPISACAVEQKHNSKSAIKDLTIQNDFPLSILKAYFNKKLAVATILGIQSLSLTLHAMLEH